VRRTGAGPAVQTSKGTSTKILKNFIFMGSQNPGTQRRTRSSAVIGINSRVSDPYSFDTGPDPGF
jgi:hypothetical protein